MPLWGRYKDRVKKRVWDNGSDKDKVRIQDIERKKVRDSRRDLG